MKQEPAPAPFCTSVRIYFEDTDAGGVVYYANYLKYLERCRADWLRAVGCEQAELMREQGIAFVVRSVSLEYLKPARLDDLISVDLDVEKITRSQIFFRQRIGRARSAPADGRDELVRGTVQVVCVDGAKMKITSIPAALRTKLEARQ